MNIPFLINSFKSDEPIGDALATARFISTRAYRELYRSMRPEDRQNINEKEFININEKVFSDLGTRSVSARIIPKEKTATSAIFATKTRYSTNYGDYENKGEYRYEKIHNQWKLIWDWNYLWPDYTPEKTITVDPSGAVPLSILDGRVQNVGNSNEWKAVYVIPRLMFDWSNYINKLGELTGKSSLEVDALLKKVVPDDYPRFVGYLPLDRQNLANEENLLPGIIVSDVDFETINNFSLDDLPSEFYKKENGLELYYPNPVIEVIDD